MRKYLNPDSKKLFAKKLSFAWEVVLHKLMNGNTAQIQHTDGRQCLWSANQSPVSTLIKPTIYIRLWWQEVKFGISRYLCFVVLSIDNLPEIELLVWKSLAPKRCAKLRNYPRDPAEVLVELFDSKRKLFQETFQMYVQKFHQSELNWVIEVILVTYLICSLLTIGVDIYNLKSSSSIVSWRSTATPVVVLLYISE